MKNLFAAGLVAATLLAGCSAPTATPAAPSTTGVKPSASAAAPTASTAPSAAATSAAPAPAKAPVTVAKKGASSAECAAASEALMKLTTIGMKANSGKVTQADVDAAFAPALMGKLPGDYKVYLDEAKAVSTNLVGLDTAAAGAYLGQFSTALDKVTRATEMICS